MASTTLVPLSEYLRTTYRPDCDYLEGRVLERNLGENPHARLQGFFTALFWLHRVDWDVQPLPEQRVQVRAERFRIPDVSVVRREDSNERIVRTPPLLCIEVLSSEDTMAEMRRRAEDYWAMGVRHVWVADPWKRLAYVYRDGQFVEPPGEILAIEGTPIAVSVAEIFAELDA